MDNALYTGIISGYNHEGMGILRLEGRTVFVPGALDTEEVRISLSGSRKGAAAWGNLEEILSSSPFRRVPPCSHYTHCGGCQLLHACYEHQLEIKQSILSRAMTPLRKKDSQIHAKILPVLAAPEPYQYRNKGIFAIGLHEDGCAVIGFYGRQSRKVAGQGCPGLFSPQVNTLLDRIACWFTENHILHTDAANRPSHIMIRESLYSGERILVLIGEKSPAWTPAFLRAFTDDSPKTLSPQETSLTGIGWLTSKSKGGTVLDGKPVTLYGSLDITEECRLDTAYKQSGESSTNDVFPLRFTLSPEAFYQVNTRQANTLYQEALKACALTSAQVVWDLYCGAGTLSLCLASRAAAVLGIDANAAAIRDAWINARRNDTVHHTAVDGADGGSAPVNDASSALTLSDRLCFLAGLAEDTAPYIAGNPGFLAGSLARQQKLYADAQAKSRPPSEAPLRLLDGKPPDIVVLDPASKGAKPAVLQAILDVKPQRIVYVSCDPATLSRDLQLLAAQGLYSIEYIQPVDMFPQTAHLESVTLLQKRK